MPDRAQGGRGAGGAGSSAASSSPRCCLPSRARPARGSSVVAAPRPLRHGDVRPGARSCAARPRPRAARACSSAARPREAYDLPQVRDPRQLRRSSRSRSLVVFVILAILLRSLLAPLLLVAVGDPVVLRRARDRRSSSSTTSSASRASTPSLPLLRVRLPGRAGDRLQHLPDGARARGDAHARHAPGHAARARRDRRGHHRRAGIVLAGTFSALAVLPLVFLTEIGFIIAFGVLLDTFLVRSVLVPALVFDLGPPHLVAVAAAARRGARERRGLRVDERAGCDCPPAPLQQDEMRGGPVRLACLSALLGLLLCVPRPGEAAAADHQRPPGRRRRVPRAGRALPDPVRLHLRRHADQQPLLPDRRALRDGRGHGRGPRRRASSASGSAIPTATPASSSRSPRSTATAPTTRTRSTTTPRCSRSRRRRRPRTSRSAW